MARRLLGAGARTAPDWVAWWAATTPQVPALLPGKEGEPPVSYAELDRRANVLARRLRAAGVGRGDLVAIAAEPRVAAGVAIVAAMRIGAALPLRPTDDAAEVRAVFAKLAPAACVTLDLNGAAAEAARAANAPIVAASGDGPAPRASTDRRQGGPRGADVALVLHSSGSTGEPRGIPRTHGNLRAAVPNYPAWVGAAALARVLVTTPLSFGMGAHAFCATLCAGGAVILPEGAPDAIAWAIRRWRPTWGYIVPTVLEAILEAVARAETATVADWRVISTSGMALASGLAERVRTGLGAALAEGYGCGEAGLLAGATRAGAPGVLDRLFHTGLATVDERGEPTPRGAPGEIVVWGPQVSHGYLGDPEATAASFDRQGRFRTGDVGVLDGADALRLIGRTKEIINRGGEKLAPAEIDAALMAHPAVAAAAAFGVPDRRLGEDVGAAVVLHRGAAASERELRRFVARLLAPSKVPRRIWLVDGLPRTESGKVRRGELARRLGGERAARDQ